MSENEYVVNAVTAILFKIAKIVIAGILIALFAFFLIG